MTKRLAQRQKYTMVSSSFSSSTKTTIPSTVDTITPTSPTSLAAPPISTMEYPSGDSVPFPYDRPYRQQVALMDALLQGVRCRSKNNHNGDDNNSEKESKTRILCLESPTGTGKSLSLACASLSWLDYQEQELQHQENSQAEQESSLTTTASTSSSWWDDWKPQDDNDNDQKAKLATQHELDRQSQLESTLQTLRSQYQKHLQNPKERRENLLRQAITKQKLQAKRLRRKRKQPQQQKPKISLRYDSDEDDENTKKYNAPIPGSTEWLLTPATSTQSSKTTTKTTTTTSTSTTINTLQQPPQIIYAARTHSQLSQFVSEVRKTKWGKTLRVVTLGSRSQGLCGYFSSKSSSTSFARDSSQLTEDCADARKTKACTHYDPSAIATLALHSLTEPTDMEDFVQLSTSSKTCGYYATRRALPSAQLVVLPYSMLTCPTTRASIGLELHNHQLILIDEAHNLPQAIANAQSCRVSLTTCRAALEQVCNYTNVYLERLSSRHLHLLGQLKLLLKGFIKAMTKGMMMVATKESDGTPTTMDDSTRKPRRVLLSPSEFLCNYKLDTINLFPIVRYMKEAQLSRKLLGFLPKATEKDTMDGTKNKNKTVSISPMSSVETLLHTLNYSNTDGKIVISASSSLAENDNENTTMMEYVVLNPAVHAQDDLYRKPAAVCLVGGTLQPINVLIQELIPSYVEDALKAQEYIRLQNAQPAQTQTQTLQHHQNSAHSSWTNPTRTFSAFSCGHVVSKSNVLLQALTRVDGVTLDIRHKTRTTPAVVHAIGVAIERLCRTVPHGVVVFFPSYGYEQHLVTAWKASGQWKRLQQAKEKVLREPKESKDIDATLAQYSQAAATSSSTTTPSGALLLSVIGGKLSEGINFADDLCRCVIVVGLPYADRSDPLLQEKLRQVANPDSFYQSLCLRAVNQSVGRAIRHANDYASIVLMDARYARDESVARGLPGWLTQSTPEWRGRGRGQEGMTDLTNVVSRVGRFFEAKQEDNE